MRLLLLAVVAVLVAAPAARAATFTVDTTADATGTCIPGSCSLREAVLAANANGEPDLIVVGAGTHTLTVGGAGEDAAATGDVDVLPADGAVTIVGAGSGPGGTVIDAATSGERAFEVIGPTGTNATFQALTLRGGAASGGGIRNTNGQIVVRDVTFAGNEIAGEGGGIHITGTGVPLTEVVDSRFEGNVASSDGGAISVDDEGRLLVARSTFAANRANGSGGAIASEDRGAVTVTESTLTGNAGRGGAIHNQNESTFTLADSLVSGNTAGGGADGGAVFHQNQGAMTIVRSVLSANTADGGRGGAIFAQNDSTLTIVDSMLSGNRALDPSASFGGGGAIFQRNNTVLRILRSTISDNETASAGGGLELRSDALSLITNSTISGNRAALDGGGLRAAGSAPVRLESTTVAGNSSQVAGGGLRHAVLLGSPPGTVEVVDSIVAGNSAPAGSECSDATGLGFSSGGGNVESAATCGFAGPGDRANANPALGPLADNGGRTRTHALLPGSAALDAAVGRCPATDQRDVPRPQGAACDSGAFERAPDPPPPPPPSVVTVPGAPVVRTLPAPVDGRPAFAALRLPARLATVARTARAFRLPLACPAQQAPACLLELRVSATVRGRRRSITRQVLGLRPGTTRTLTLRLPAPVRAELRRGRRVAVLVSARQATADGRLRSLSRRYTLTARRR